MNVTKNLSELLESKKIKFGTKEMSPQKHLLKFICDCLYFCGTGVVWYEERKRTKTQKIFYNIWVTISNFYMFAGVLNELMGNFRKDLTKKEESDLTQFTLAHTTVSLKILGLYILKGRIKMLFVRFFEDYKRDDDLIELEKRSVTIAIRYSIVLCMSVYMTLVSASIDAIVTTIKDGVPIRTEVTYYPFGDSPRLQFNVFRILQEIHWYYLVTVMNLIDCLCVCSLVFLCFKFKYIQIHFRKIREKLLENYEKKSLGVLRQEYETELLIGIKMHTHAVWCARNVQNALGNLYSIQVLESIVCLMMCLVKLVVVELELTYVLATLTYYICVVLLTGAYMMSAGDITYEAAAIPTAIFDSGWELISAPGHLRTLIVVTMINSQVPVFMTAFGVLILSYSNFLVVMRSSYSFFAVMY